MEKKSIQTIRMLAVLSVYFLLLAYQQLYSSNNKQFLIKKVGPSHIEKNHKFTRLVKHSTIPTDFSKKFFFARPMELVVNENGNIYIYDDLLNKILKFKSNHNFDKAFGESGQGPGDFTPSKSYKALGVFKNKVIVSDYRQKKLIIFSENGEFQREVKFPSHISFAFPLITFRTISLKDVLIHSPDKNNIRNFNPNQIKITDDISYIISGNTEGKAYIGKCNENYNTIKHFLFEVAYYPFLIHLPGNPNSFSCPDFGNTFIKVIPKSQIVLIYVANSSTLYIFNPNNSVKSFFIAPDNQCKSFKNLMVRLKKKLKRHNKRMKVSLYATFFEGFFLDQDNWEYLYFTGSSNYGNDKKYLLYKYDFKGNLVNILYHYETHKVDFMAKKNGYYYSIDHFNDEIKIFKEKNDE